VTDREKYQKLLVGPIERFDQRNDMFRRTRYDPVWVKRAKKFYGPMQPRDVAGYRLEEQSLAEAAWYVEEQCAKGCQGSSHPGLYAWKVRSTSPGQAQDQDSADPEDIDNPPDLRVDASDPCRVTKKVKRAARLFGASLVGVCEADPRWLYSRLSDDISGEYRLLELQEGMRWVVAMAVEMDYDLIQTAPTAGAAAATGLGYSKMAFLAALLAQFIRNLGYQAFPCGNDTALSIPIAVEAGLGELGRNGLLITEKFGPRVRLCKVFTDLPLVPDEPRFFGVEQFCRVCLRCADECLPRAISHGERTTAALNISTNPGVLKWPVNAEQCFKYWAANGLDCSTCIRVCPFNQEAGQLHDMVRLGIKHIPWLDRLFLWFGGALGYGKQLDPEGIWDG
jgi:epoxyqueuosine reductase